MPTTGSGLAGTWRGTLTDRVTGTTAVTLILNDLFVGASLATVHGTWEAPFPPGTRTTSGIVSGAKESSAARWLIYLDPSGFPPCADRPFPYSVHGQGFELSLTRSADRLSGAATYRTCSESFEGTVDLTLLR